MRILFINVIYKSSSTGKIVHDLYTRSREDGHEAAVCYGRGMSIKEPDVYKFGLDWETYLHALMTRVTGLTGVWSFFSTRRLLRFIDEYKPDVVNMHEMYSYFVNTKPVFDYLAKHNIPVVYTFHCEDAYTGKCGYAFECERWKTGCGKCPHLRDYPKSLLFDFTRWMHQLKRKQWENLHKIMITTPSQWLANRVKESFLGNRRICAIHNGIDTTNIFYPHNTEDLRAELGLKNEKIVLTVAPGLMTSRKGGKWVVKLAQRMKDENIKFIMVGIDNLNETFPENVIPMGKVMDQQRLATLYTLADCFVICSEKETFSMTCAESLCCGTPVAGFCSGAPETVFMPPYARFAPYGDLEALENYVKMQLNAGYDRVKLAKNMQDLYSRDNMYRQYMETYEEMIGEVSR